MVLRLARWMPNLFSKEFNIPSVGNADKDFSNAISHGAGGRSAGLKGVLIQMMLSTSSGLSRAIKAAP